MVLICGIFLLLSRFFFAAVFFLHCGKNKRHNGLRHVFHAPNGSRYFHAKGLDTFKGNLMPASLRQTQLHILSVLLKPNGCHSIPFVAQSTCQPLSKSRLICEQCQNRGVGRKWQVIRRLQGSKHLSNPLYIRIQTDATNTYTDFPSFQFFSQGLDQHNFVQSRFSLSRSISLGICGVTCTFGLPPFCQLLKVQAQESRSHPFCTCQK